MKKKGKDLVFISRIKRDGSGVVPVDKETLEQLQNCPLEKYKLMGLSISSKTFIASSFNSYVVKLKNK